MSRYFYAETYLYDSARRAIQTLEAVMHQPPVPLVPRSDDPRLIELIAELLAENRLLRMENRMLRERTNGPAANGAVVILEKEEERTDA